MAMTDVQAALLQHVKQRPEMRIFEVPIPNLGLLVRLRGLTSSEYLRLLSECTVDGVLHLQKLRVRVITETLLDPDVHDVDFLKALDVATPEDAVLKVFSDPEDFNCLVRMVDKLCGLEGERGEFRQVQ